MRVDKLALLACAAGVALAQHAYTPGDIEDGGRLFQANCVACHGPDGDMVQGIDFGHGKFRGPSSDEALMKVIRNGIAGTAMTPHNFTEFQAGIVVAYLRSMAAAGHGKSGSGDAERGKLLFESKGGCAGCHRVYGVGSRTGPDLSEIGSLRRAVELEQALLEPNRAILLQNRTYRAVTRDGETITGKASQSGLFFRSTSRFEGTAAFARPV